LILRISALHRKRQKGLAILHGQGGVNVTLGLSRFNHIERIQFGSQTKLHALHSNSVSRNGRAGIQPPLGVTIPPSLLCLLLQWKWCPAKPFRVLIVDRRRRIVRCSATGSNNQERVLLVFIRIRIARAHLWIVVIHIDQFGSFLCILFRQQTFDGSSGGK
jgi:hypothetical protein